MANRWPKYHKPSPEQAKAMADWMDAKKVPQLLRSPLRTKFCRLNLTPEQITATTGYGLLDAKPPRS